MLPPKANAIKDLKRQPPGSAPLCVGFGHARVLNGLGIAIVSTSKGIMTDAQARKGERGRRGAVLHLLIANH